MTIALLGTGAITKSGVQSDLKKSGVSGAYSDKNGH